MTGIARPTFFVLASSSLFETLPFRYPMLRTMAASFSPSPSESSSSDVQQRVAGLKVSWLLINSLTAFWFRLRTSPCELSWLLLLKSITLCFGSVKFDTICFSWESTVIVYWMPFLMKPDKKLAKSFFMWSMSWKNKLKHSTFCMQMTSNTRLWSSFSCVLRFSSSESKCFSCMSLMSRMWLTTLSSKPHQLISLFFNYPFSPSVHPLIDSFLLSIIAKIALW